MLFCSFSVFYLYFCATMVKVSIIMPVYNTRKYLTEAIESVQAQSLSEWQLICVDDGSTDGSGELLNAFAAKDCRIKVLSQKNGGQSKARNNAMSFATGEYIYFMDSDDVLDKDLLLTCYKSCIEGNLDFCFFDAVSIDEKGNETYEPNYDRRGILQDRVYKGEELLVDLQKRYKLCTAPWCNFIRHEFYKNSKQSFYDGIIHEDELFTARLYLRADRVKCLPVVLYKYRQRSDSTMGNRFGKRNMKGYFTVARELIKDKANLSGHQQRLIDDYLSMMLDAAIWRTYVMPFGDKIQVLSYAFCHYRKYIKSITFAKALFKM